MADISGWYGNTQLHVIQQWKSILWSQWGSYKTLLSLIRILEICSWYLYTVPWAYNICQGYDIVNDVVTHELALTISDIQEQFLDMCCRCVSKHPVLKRGVWCNNADSGNKFCSPWREEAQYSIQHKNGHKCFAHTTKWMSMVEHRKQTYLCHKMKTWSFTCLVLCGLRGNLEQLIVM